jgi:DNA-binding FadR family transcriptional regulator
VTDLQDAMSILIHSEHATFLDVLVARRAVDPIIAGEAAAKATTELVQDLDSIVERLNRPSLTQREFLAGSTDFHGALVSAANLVILGLFLKILTSFGEGSLFQSLALDEEYRSQMVASFLRIRDAVADRDSDTATAEMVLHRKMSEDHWLQKGEAFLRSPLSPFQFGL